MKGGKIGNGRMDMKNNFKNMIFCKTGKAELSLKAKKSYRVTYAKLTFQFSY